MGRGRAAQWGTKATGAALYVVLGTRGSCGPAKGRVGKAPMCPWVETVRKACSGLKASTATPHSLSLPPLPCLSTPEPDCSVPPPWLTCPTPLALVPPPPFEESLAASPGLPLTSPSTARPNMPLLPSPPTPAPTRSKPCPPPLTTAACCALPAPCTRVPYTRVPCTRVACTRAPRTRAPYTRAPCTRAPYARVPYTRVPRARLQLPRDGGPPQGGAGLLLDIQLRTWVRGAVGAWQGASRSAVQGLAWQGVYDSMKRVYGELQRPGSLHRAGTVPARYEYGTLQPRGRGIALGGAVVLGQMRQTREI